MAAFNSFEGRKAIFLLAAIWIDAPVAGLRPARAGRSLTSRIPRPLMRSRLPAVRCVTSRPTIFIRTASACFFGIEWLSPNCSARCFSVMTVGVASFGATRGWSGLDALVALARADVLTGKAAVFVLDAGFPAAAALGAAFDADFFSAMVRCSFEADGFLAGKSLGRYPANKNI